MRPSPKHRFFAELSFSHPLRGIGSVVSYGGNDLSELVSLLRSEAIRYGVKEAYAVIWDKKKSGELTKIKIIRFTAINI